MSDAMTRPESETEAGKGPEPRDATTRRRFLKRMATGLSGVAIVIVGGDLTRIAAGAGSGANEPRGSGLRYDPTRHRWIYVIDITKCIGCGSCVRACAAENDVPDHYFRTWIERYMVSRTGASLIDSPNGGKDGFEPEVTGREITKAFFVPKICNHCTHSPCVQLCPVGASYRSPDGVILVDRKRCIGCSYCVQACPYGSRFIHPETHTASKCTLCYHRISRGLLPACVQACPTGTRRFGDARKLGDEVAEIVATRRVAVLKPELRTDPNCYYLGMSREVR
jgi:tetrathionate reductase subunit B